MSGRKVGRLWPLLAVPLLLGGCAAPYSPGSWPDFANVPYYPPGSFLLRLDGPYRGRPVPPISAVSPPDWAVPTPPRYREPDNSPPDSPPAASAPEPAPSEPKQAAVPAPKSEPVSVPRPVEVRAPEPLRPVDPSCGWWRLCNFWSRS